MKTKIIFLFLFGCILSLEMIAQESAIVSSQNLKSQISAYKQDLLIASSKSLKKLKALKQEIRDSELKEAKKEKLIKIISLLPKSYKKDWAYDQALEILFKRKYQGELLKKIKDIDAEFLELNLKVFALKRLKIFKSNTDGIQDLVSEIEFYQLANHQTIGEIGAGFGDFSFILIKLFDFEKIYINELNSDHIKRMKKIKKDFPSKKDKIQIIKGSKKSSKLENKKLDKIIIRNTFHHFSKSESMIKSIADALNPDGILYLSEPVTEIGGDKKVCREAISKKEILKSLSSFDFKLEREMIIGDFLLMEFKQKQTY